MVRIMTLNYDFDMVAVQPDVIFSDPKLAGLLNGPGARSTIAAHHVALFRDPGTVRAFRDAPQPLRTYLIASGFSGADHLSEVPKGIYPLREETLRVRLMERMATNVGRFPLPKAAETPQGWGTFQLQDLLTHLFETRAVADDALENWLATQRARRSAKAGAEAGPAVQKPGGLMSRWLGRVVN
jgi:hypothetical protein